MLALVICGQFARWKGKRWWSWGLLGLVFQWTTAVLLLTATASANHFGMGTASPLIASGIGLLLAMATVYLSIKDEEWQKAQAIWLS